MRCTCITKEMLSFISTLLTDRAMKLCNQQMFAIKSAASGFPVMKYVYICAKNLVPFDHIVTPSAGV